MSFYRRMLISGGRQGAIPGVWGAEAEDGEVVIVGGGCALVSPSCRCVTPSVLAVVRLAGRKQRTLIPWQAAVPWPRSALSRFRPRNGLQKRSFGDATMPDKSEGDSLRQEAQPTDRFLIFFFCGDQATMHDEAFLRVLRRHPHYCWSQ